MCVCVCQSRPAFPVCLTCRCLVCVVLQLEAFYSIFTTEQQDHVKSVEYLRNNFRPLQSLDNREVYKSAIKDAWLPDLTSDYGSPYESESSKGKKKKSKSPITVAPLWEYVQ